MADIRRHRYEVEQVIPNADRQKLWDLFVDPEAWSTSNRLPGKLVIVSPGKGHPQGIGAVRKVMSGSMTIIEDIVGFQPSEYFSYISRNGDMPVNDFAGEVFFEKHPNMVVVRYRAAFNAKYFATGWLFKIIFRRAHKSALRGLALDYADRRHL